MKNERYTRIVLVFILTGVVLPPLLIGTFLFLTPSMTPEEAAQLMRD